MEHRIKKAVEKKFEDVFVDLSPNTLVVLGNHTLIPLNINGNVDSLNNLSHLIASYNGSNLISKNDANEDVQFYIKIEKSAYFNYTYIIKLLYFILNLIVFVFALNGLYKEFNISSIM